VKAAIRLARSGATRLAIGSACGVTATLLLTWFATPADAQTLRGSRSSIDRQHTKARQEDFTFLRRPTQVERFVDAGLLVPLESSEHYRLHNVSFGVARPEVKLFVERLAAQYLAACGERLVVTSLTRPTSRQPANASSRSVHPTGMAVDLRVPSTRSCRGWLESTLVSLERKRVLDATLERSPAHFHVAVFPDEYLAYAAQTSGRPGSALLASVQGPTQHTVRASETLWEIARRYGTTPAQIKRANGLTGSVIRPGQTLDIPGGA
jgi:LysM repeat protein